MTSGKVAIAEQHDRRGYRPIPHLKKHFRSDVTCWGLTIVRFGPKEKTFFRSFSWSKSLIKKSFEQWMTFFDKRLHNTAQR